MTKLLIAISFLFLVGIPFANAEQVYYCASELATGIVKDEKTGKWKEMGFNQERYTIKFNDDYTSLDGIDKTTWSCVAPFANSSQPILKNRFVCYDSHDFGLVFTFDKQTHRFFYMNGTIFGYLHNEKDSDTNSIYAGTCQKF
jgi:hypothetical protein